MFVPRFIYILTRVVDVRHH